MSSKRCSVIGCPANNEDTSKNLMKFPTGSDLGGKVAKLWQDFTRQPGAKASMFALCQEHFSSECIKEIRNGFRKFKRLKKDSVPTVFITKDNEMVLMPYDPISLTYYDHQLDYLWNHLQPPLTYDSALLTTRLDKVNELKTLCRFCFTKNSTCVSINQLQTFGMNPMDILKQIGSNLEYHASFSELICESCILKVIEIEKFKNLCCTNQVKVVRELKGLDAKIKDMMEMCGKSPGFRIEENWFDINVENVAINSARCELKRLEKILERNRPDTDSKVENKAETIHSSSLHESNPLSTENGTDDDNFHIVTVKSEPDSLKIAEVIIKEEPDERFSDDNNDYDINASFGDAMDDRSSDNDEMNVDVKIDLPENPRNFSDSDDSDSQFRNRKNKNQKKRDPTKKPTKNPNAVKPPPKSKQQIALLRTRTYECFFCREEFVGNVNYVEHQCRVKNRSCEVEGCTMKFVRQSGFTTHQMRVHGLPKTMLHYCPCCNSCLQMSSLEIRAHINSCKKPRYREKPIDCNICKNTYNTLQSYLDHVIDHDSKGLDVKIDEKTGEVTITKKKIMSGRKKSLIPPPKKLYNPADKKERFCDLCGKTFSSVSTFIIHRHRVHLTTFKGEMYKCQECNFEGKSRIVIRDHVRNVHKINPTDCPVCGKTFQTKVKMKRHKKYQHEQSTMAIKCEICPSKPSFKSNTLLQKHIGVTHGFGSETMVGWKCSVEGCHAAYATELNLNRHLENIHGLQSA